MKIISFFVLISLIFDQTFSQPQPNESQPHLVAFSLNGAKKSLLANSGKTNQLIQRLGYITKIWGVILDETDLIVVGERDNSLPSMILDDLIVAIRIRNKISDEKENPGVSIEPVILDKYTRYQKVKYYGGIDKTHYGKICFEADLLLKKLSMGHEITGIPGFPSEWDLKVDNNKANRRSEPWNNQVSRSWFFPLKININKYKECAALSSIKMQVKTDATPTDLKDFISINPDSLKKILKVQPDAVSFIYSQLFTRNFDKIARKHPILLQLQNLMALSGLVAEVLQDVNDSSLNYWIDEYQVAEVGSPAKIPTLSNGINGLSYNAFISGGISVNYKVGDGWSNAVIARKPKYLKQAALLSRPSKDAISWRIPLELGSPKNWTPDDLKELRDKELKESHKFLKDLPPEFKYVDPGIQKWLDTPGWHPSTEKENLFNFNSSLFFSTGGFETFSPRGRFSVSGSEIALGIPIEVKLVFKNSVEFGIKVPFMVRTNFRDSPSPNLPGISDQIITYAGGIENPIITNRIQIMDGVKNGRWKLPGIVFENSLVLPFHSKLFDGFIGIKENSPIPFASNTTLFSHGLRTMIPISQNSILMGGGEYQTPWRDSVSINERFLYDIGVIFVVEKDLNLRIGFHLASSFEYDTGIFQNDKEWLNQGNQYLLSFSYPTRKGGNRVYFGWYAPSDYSNLNGTFLFSFELNSVHFWDLRAWF